MFNYEIALEGNMNYSQALSFFQDFTQGEILELLAHDLKRAAENNEKIHVAIISKDVRFISSYVDLAHIELIPNENYISVYNTEYLLAVDFQHIELEPSVSYDTKTKNEDEYSDARYYTLLLHGKDYMKIEF